MNQQEFNTALNQAIEDDYISYMESGAHYDSDREDWSLKQQQAFEEQHQVSTLEWD